jgi:hypothetical protein
MNIYLPLQGEIAVKSLWSARAPYLTKCPIAITEHLPPTLHPRLEKKVIPRTLTYSIELENLIFERIRQSEQSGISFMEIWSSLAKMKTPLCTNLIDSLSKNEETGNYIVTLRDEIASNLFSLCEKNLVSRVLAYDHHRYVQSKREILTLWTVPKTNGDDEELVCLRPWMSLSLSIHSERFWGMCSKIICNIWASPGLSRKEIYSQVKLIE